MKRPVHNKRIIQTILLILGIVVVFSGITFLANDRSDTNVREQSNNNTAPVTEQITLSIDGRYDERVVSFERDDTLLDVLTALDASDPALDLTLETYEGVGTLVTGMAGKENGTDDQYWQYTVDGAMPMVGADAYMLSGGETIEWMFTASEF